MKRAVLACLSLAFAAPASADDFAPQWLQAHNQERAQLHMPPLRWSAKLAGDAQRWADSLAQRGSLQHSTDRGATGENLWMGTAGYFGADAMIGAFLAEKRWFRPGRFPDVSSTGNWSTVGHYSQIIWPQTQEVGCALAKGKGRDVLVCRYWPAGNVFGQAVG